MKKILIVKTSSLGDVVHCLPAINDILAHHPNAQIDWVVEQSFADIPRLHPHVNEVFTVAVRRWRKAMFSQKTWAEISEFKKNIQQNQYDIIIDAQGLLKSALITRQANGVKHGYDKHSIREPLASWFYDVKHAISYQQHAVTRNRTLCALSLGYAPPTDAPDYGISAEHIEKKYTELKLADNYVIGLHGTSKASKLWPLANWVALGQALNKQGLALVLPWGNDAEQARAQTIAAQVPNSIVLPKLGIADLASVISQATAAVGVDTGLTHLAVALSRPTVAIYTDTNPALTGVLAGKHAPALNLGGITQVPSVDEVLATLQHMQASLL